MYVCISACGVSNKYSTCTSGCTVACTYAGSLLTASKSASLAYLPAHCMELPLSGGPCSLRGSHVIASGHRLHQKAGRSVHYSQQPAPHTAEARLRTGSPASMASGAAQHGAASETSIAALPSEIVEHICHLLHEPDDLASCHQVDTRYARNTAVCVCQVRRKLMIRLSQSSVCQSNTTEPNRS